MNKQVNFDSTWEQTNNICQHQDDTDVGIIYKDFKATILRIVQQEKQMILKLMKRFKILTSKK